MICKMLNRIFSELWQVMVKMKKKKDENDIFGVLIVTDYDQKNVQNFQKM